VARYIQFCLNDIGIQMEIQSGPRQEIAARYLGNSDFQAVLTQFCGGYRKAATVISGWLPDEQGNTLAGRFSHPEVTRLLNLAAQTADAQAEKEYLSQVDALLAELQPGTFLFQKTAFDVMSKKFLLVRPFTLKHEGIHWLRLASVTPPQQ